MAGKPVLLEAGVWPPSTDLINYTWAIGDDVIESNATNGEVCSFLGGGGGGKNIKGGEHGETVFDR